MKEFDLIEWCKDSDCSTCDDCEAGKAVQSCKEHYKKETHELRCLYLANSAELQNIKRENDNKQTKIDTQEDIIKILCSDIKEFKELLEKCNKTIMSCLGCLIVENKEQKTWIPEHIKLCEETIKKIQEELYDKGKSRGL